MDKLNPPAPVVPVSPDSPVHCSTCGLGVVRLPGRISTGYGVDAEGRKHCFSCCGARDRAEMEAGKPVTLYLTGPRGESVLTNWPGTLRIPAFKARKGRHNIAGTRYDVWFTFAGHSWHGVQYGEQTQLCHCRPIKSR